MRRVVIVAGVAAAVALALAGGTAVWLARTLPCYACSFAVEGLRAEVQVVRDAHAVPHIFATDARDAYLALGFAHAQDRLWQMEMQRRMASGRLAELVGERALPLDRLARLLGFARLAAAEHAMLPAETREGLAAYAAGVNAWIAAAPALPPELALLGATVEPWRPEDSVALMRAMAAQLAFNVREELLHARAARRLDAEQFADIFPAVPWAPPLATAAALDDAAADLRALGRAGASNLWAIAGARTESGRPILASDPHMALGAPALWYLARLEAPGASATGATVPGFPFVLLGHNGRIAWAMTSSGFDVQDLFVERIDPADPDRYLVPEGSQRFERRREVIAVAGRASEELVVRTTRHGPVLSDVGPRAAALAVGGTVIALAYTGLDPRHGSVEAIHRINQAGGWADFVAAAQLWAVPPQNLAMAARDGTIGMVSAGRMPVRGGADGRMPRPGWTGAHDWHGFVPFAALPRIVDPPAGTIVNANDAVAVRDAGEAARYLGDPPDEGLRAARIAALLARPGPHRVADSLAIQGDAHASDAAVLLPLLLRAAPRDARSREAMALLQAWDRTMLAERPEPLIYVAWLRELMRTLFAEPLGDAFADFWAPRPAAIARALANAARWCAGAERDCADAAGAALARALDEVAHAHGPSLQAWRWGTAHRAELVHQVWSEVPGVARLLDLSVAVDGGDFTVGVMATAFSRASAPFAGVFGPAFRAVYDLGDLDRSRFVVATGQSGHPLSRHFGDLVPAWRDGAAIAIAGAPEAVARTGRGTTRLAPRP